METFNLILNPLKQFILEPSIFSLLTLLILSKALKIDLNKKLLNFYKYIFLSYGLISIIHLLTSFLINGRESEEYIFLEKATGYYLIMYIVMQILNTFSPLLTLVRNNLLILTIVSFAMNFGWLFESFVVHVTSIHRDTLYDTTNWMSFLPYPRELKILLIGIVTGICLILIAKRKQLIVNETSIIDN